MIKIVKMQEKYQDRIIEMQQMKPLQVAEIVGKSGQYVMRTAYEHSLEVMVLSFPGPGKCWVGEPTIKVRLLDPGEKITVEMYNEKEVIA